MSTTATHPTAITRTLRLGWLQPQHARLVPDDRGWAIVNLNGQVIVRAAGRESRRECLDSARAAGILAVHR
jgi:hypothetical protein